ncbi:MAG: MraY family glycosyltransferase [Bacillota bacterium]
MEKLLLGFLAAFGLAWFLTPYVRKMAFRIGAVDLPDQRKVHDGVMPRLGGLAIYLSFVIVVLATRDPTPAVLGLIAGATAIVLVGVIDDIRGLPAWTKLAGQVAAAACVIPFGINVQFLTNPLNGEMIYLGLLGIPLTIIWLVAVTNAVNLIDGLDGLAGGVSCIAAITLGVVALTQWQVFGIGGQAEVITMAFILACAILGFLKFNFHPARIFLGDTGSMFLGFTLATLAVMGVAKSATAISVFIPLVILGIPLLDSVFAVIRRYNTNRPIFQPDKEHLHHQLLAMGLTHRQTVLVIYAVSLALGISAVLLNLLTTDQAALLLLGLAIVAIAGANRIGVAGRRSRASLPAVEKVNGRSSEM